VNGCWEGSEFFSRSSSVPHFVGLKLAQRALTQANPLAPHPRAAADQLGELLRFHLRPPLQRCVEGRSFQQGRMCAIVLGRPNARSPTTPVPLTVWSVGPQTLKGAAALKRTQAPWSPGARPTQVTDVNSVSWERSASSVRAQFSGPGSWCDAGAVLRVVLLAPRIRWCRVSVWLWRLSCFDVVTIRVR
jgi:hypothetical protein